jgi:hypothetical protein
VEAKSQHAGLLLEGDEDNKIGEANTVLLAGLEFYLATGEIGLNHDVREARQPPSTGLLAQRTASHARAERQHGRRAARLPAL